MRQLQSFQTFGGPPQQRFLKHFSLKEKNKKKKEKKRKSFYLIKKKNA